MTHAELVSRALRWLRNTMKHPLVIAEIASWYEQPDVIGWTTRSDCTLVECKASRADFLRDRKKYFRRNPEAGLGARRWYFAPPGIVRVIDLPERWGLAEVRANIVRVIRKPERFDVTPTMLTIEKRLLVSACRRATEGWGRKVFGDLVPTSTRVEEHA
jgi:hypothetical protein